MCLFSIFVYSPLAHWTWHPDGFLHKLGVLDFAGGTVVHMSAGFAALAGAMVLGRRKTHKNGEATHAGEHPVRDPRHRHAVVRLVRLQRRIGALARRARRRWRSRRRTRRRRPRRSPGSSSTACAVNKPSALGACVGAVVGLVAITPAAGYVSIGESIFIGTVASVVSNLMVHWKNALDARRHARRLPVPRCRRDGRHADDRHVRQGRRLDVRPRHHVPGALRRAAVRGGLLVRAVRGSSTGSPTSSFRCASPKNRKRSASISASTAR